MSCNLQIHTRYVICVHVCIPRNMCNQMASLALKFIKIQFQPGLGLRSHWEHMMLPLSISHLSRPLASHSRCQRHRGSVNLAPSAFRQLFASDRSTADIYTNLLILYVFYHCLWCYSLQCLITSVELAPYTSSVLTWMKRFTRASNAEWISTWVP